MKLPKFQWNRLPESTLEIEATGSSEMSADFYDTSLRNILEDSDLHFINGFGTYIMYVFPVATV
jgi:hypothetical protein